MEKSERNQYSLHCAECLWCMIQNNERQCHFNAPQMVGGSGTGYSDRIWPIVQPTDYCSKYVVKPD